MNVACLGDSITYAQHLPREQAWPSLLAERFGWRVANHGVCGDTTRLALERIGTVLVGQPDVLVVQFGLNDCNRWHTDRGAPRVSLPAFEANLEEIVDRADRHDVRHVVLMGTTPCWRESLLDPHLYMQAIERAAEETGSHLHRLDYLTTDHLLDGVHLDAEGNRLIADELGETLCRL